eukprot:2005489-Rhodomonas_salina.2
MLLPGDARHGGGRDHAAARDSEGALLCTGRRRPRSRRKLLRVSVSRVSVYALAMRSPVLTRCCLYQEENRIKRAIRSDVPGRSLRPPYEMSGTDAAPTRWLVLTQRVPHYQTCLL